MCYRPTRDSVGVDYSSGKGGAAAREAPTRVPRRSSKTVPKPTHSGGKNPCPRRDPDASATKRQQVLAYADSLRHVEARAVRARLSIHQLHLTEFTHDSRHQH